MIDNPFGGGIKKAPGLLISRLTYLLTPKTQNRATGGKYPLSRSGFLLSKNDWHCKSTKMIGYDIV